MTTNAMKLEREIFEKKLKKNKISSIIAPVLAFSLLILIWQVLIMVFNVPAWKLPKPSDAFISMFTDFDEYLPHIIRSYSTILIGFSFAVILGIFLAALINNFKILGVALTPYINLMCTTPLITLVPLLILWLGFGQYVIILAVMLQAFPILNMNAFTGFNNVETIKLELMLSLRASKIQTFFYCIFPDALPHVFTGMKLSGIFATIAGISSEFTGGDIGLGAQIISNTQFMRMNQAFACIFYVAIIGLFLYLSICWAESKLVKGKI